MAIDKRTKITSLIMLLIAAVLAAIVAGTSFSRYVFDSEDNIVGSFTNLYFSHNGQGTTVLMEQTDEGYEGYISLSAFNWQVIEGEQQTSARHIQYKVRALTQNEITNGLHDMWNTEIPLENDTAKTNSSKYSEVTPDYSYDASEDTNSDGIITVGNFTDGQGYQVTSSGEVTLAFGSDAGDGDPVQDTRADMIKIVRNGSDFSTAEEFYIVVEIVSPYNQIMVFTVNASTRLISVAATDINNPDSHFGYDEVALNIKTARDYVYSYDNDTNDVSVNSSKPAKVVLTWTTTGSTSVIFDEGRFFADTEGNFTKLSADYTSGASWQNGWYVETSEDGKTVTLTLYLPQATDINLCFYVPESYTCRISAWFYDNVADSDGTAATNTAYPYTEIAGATNGTVVSK
ncbi:MAG TPA: hypothetical protein IAB25_04970 [Candidatus Coproplasma stercoravium]|nr:hypothetical protein [Candidatus Coproplasma stercoravium]